MAGDEVRYVTLTAAECEAIRTGHPGDWLIDAIRRQLTQPPGDRAVTEAMVERGARGAVREGNGMTVKQGDEVYVNVRVSSVYPGTWYTDTSVFHHGEEIPNGPLLRWLAGIDAEPDAGLVETVRNQLTVAGLAGWDAHAVAVLDALKGGHDGG